MLEKTQLEDYICRLESRREEKLGRNRLITNRDNPYVEGTGLPLRIFDRLADVQDYCSSQYADNNRLIDKYARVNFSAKTLANLIAEDLGIDISTLRNLGKKEKVLDRLIELVEQQQIGVARFKKYKGLIPFVEEVRKTYGSSSGFIMHDEKFPYILLPARSIKGNRFEESTGRQIYTLLFLVVALALDYSNLIVQGHVEELLEEDKHKTGFVYDVVAEMMLPAEEAREFVLSRKFGDQLILDLAQKCKLTPTAVYTILKRRRLVPGDYVFEPEYSVGSSGGGKNPGINVAARRFYGNAAINQIIAGVSSIGASGVARLPATEAQHLLFGRTNKVLWRKIRSKWRI